MLWLAFEICLNFLLPSSEVIFFDGFHLSGWYIIASLRNVVLTSLTVEVKLIPKTLNSCQRIKSMEKEEKEEDGVIGGEENF